MMPGRSECARLIGTASAWLARSAGELWRDGIAATTWRGRAFGLLVLLALVTLPAWGGTPLIAAMIAVLWLAYAGSAWNLLAGFAGLFSLGHGLFIGIGAYLAAFFVLHGGLGAWPGALLALPVAAVAGAALGALGCRAGFKAAHFTLVSLILAEAVHLAVIRCDGLGGGGGLALPHPAAAGKPVLFYYAILVLTGLALAAIRLLLRSRLGYRWLAVREDAGAAAACGIDVYRARISAAAVSAALAAPAGVFLALYLRSANPGEILSLAGSLGPVLGAALGGIGTLVGPVLGAFVVVPADQALSWLIGRSHHHDLAALKPLAAGLALMLVAVAAPSGIWPGFARRLGLLKAPSSDTGEPT